MRDDLKPTQKWWVATLFLVAAGALGALGEIDVAGLDAPVWLDIAVVVAGPVAVWLRSDKE